MKHLTCILSFTCMEESKPQPNKEHWELTCAKEVNEQRHMEVAGGHSSIAYPCVPERAAFTILFIHHPLEHSSERAMRRFYLSKSESPGTQN
jgi:hypothetical protein